MGRLENDWCVDSVTMGLIFKKSKGCKTEREKGKGKGGANHHRGSKTNAMFISLPKQHYLTAT